MSYSHATSVLYYNKEKPENYLVACNMINIFIEINRHILNPTHDRDLWYKNDQGPMTPPEPMNKRRGRKTLLRRKRWVKTLAS